MCLYRHLESDEPIVCARPSPIGAALQVFVYVKDRPDLFAGICAYFDRNGLSVLDARVTTTRHGYALDNFLVSHPDHDGSYRDIVNLVEQQLASLTDEGTSCRSRPEDACRGWCALFRLRRVWICVPTSVVSTTSCPCPRTTGRAFFIRSRACHRIGVQAARINTLGERVEDVFLLDGKSLSSNRTQIQVETELLRAIAA